MGVQMNYGGQPQGGSGMFSWGELLGSAMGSGGGGGGGTGRQMADSLMMKGFDSYKDMSQYANPQNIMGMLQQAGGGQQQQPQMQQPQMQMQNPMALMMMAQNGGWGGW